MAPSKDESQPQTGRSWLLVLGFLVCWQGWLTLGLFGEERSWQNLINDQPILTGRHALHLYHGYLGAQAFKDGARTVSYDPGFCAGYPKTPWFDSGSKPAEFFLWVSGGEYRPAVYKIGLALCWLLLPVTLAGAGLAVGMSRTGSCLAALLGMVVGWSDFGQGLLRAGDTDLLPGFELAVLTLALLVRYDTAPRFGIWLGLTGAWWGVCFCQVWLVLTLLPVLLVFYFWRGGRHRLGWHAGLWLALLMAVGGNWFWLQEAVDYWWLRADSLSTQVHDLPRGVLAALWENDLWRNPPHRGLALALVGGAVVGLLVWRWSKQRTAMRVVGTALIVYLGVALFGCYWEPLNQLEPGRLLFLALILATLPAAVTLMSTFALMNRLTGSPVRGAVVAVSVLLACSFFWREPLGQLAARGLRSEPLPVGPSAEVQATLQVLQEHTTAEARILWEEGPETVTWTPLLPLWTRRSYLGGLGLSARIDHANVRLVQGELAGVPLRDWSDARLTEFCQRYNVGWIVCRSPAALARLREWHSQSQPEVIEAAILPVGGQLFAVQRPPSFFLKGQARILSCDHKRLTLADLNPAGEELVLSFHYHAGIAASTDRVKIERAPQLDDPIPLIRLRVPGPMSRLTLYWQE